MRKFRKRPGDTDKNRKLMRVLIGSLFSFGGRIGRGEYFAGHVFRFVILLAPIFVALSLKSLKLENEDIPAIALAILFVLFLPFFIWAGLALDVKRCHDLEHSGWWLLSEFGALLVLSHYQELQNGWASLVFPILFFGVLGVFGLCYDRVKRFRGEQKGDRKWEQLIFLISLCVSGLYGIRVGLALLFCPGENGSNRYGQKQYF